MHWFSDWHVLYVVLQTLRWCCVDCVIHHEQDVREEQHHTYMWREQAIIEWSWHLTCEALRICRSGFPIATVVSNPSWGLSYVHNKKGYLKWIAISNLNNAYWMMHYIPRNVSVRPHQVSSCVRTFNALLRNNLYRFFVRWTSSSNFFIRLLQMSDAFYKSSFFPQLFNAPVIWRPNAVGVRELFRCLGLISTAFV